MIRAVYIHIPFCDHICNYCDFCKLYYNEKIVINYLKTLEQELKSRYKKEIIKTLYIGGGSPSCLNIANLNYLFKIINNLNLAHDLEFTMECNFDSMTLSKIKLLKKNKVNRLSFGLETTNKTFLQEINRNINKTKVKKIIKDCHNNGINNINIDLMYGFKNETIDDVKKDLDFITNLDIKHISTYSLMINKNTKLYIDNYQRLDDDNDYIIYNFINKYLKAKKFIHYEISNYGLKGYFSKHNLEYWNNSEYYGFGLSASGYINNIRYTNTRSISNYLKGNYVYEEERLTIHDKMIYELIVGFRKTRGICLQEFEAKYHFNLLEKSDIIRLVNNKELMVKNGYIYINPKRLYVSNSILVDLLGEVYE